MEIIFLKDLPYFLTISLSVMPVSRAGGSFCSVSIKTWRHREHIQISKADLLCVINCTFLGKCSHLHWWIFVIRCSPCGELDGRDSETPNIGFEIVTPHLWKENRIQLLQISSAFITTVFALWHRRKWISLFQAFKVTSRIKLCLISCRHGYF